MKSKKEELEALIKEFEDHLKSLQSLDKDELPSLKRQQKFVKKAKELEEKIAAASK